jgi:hypothetical protein
MGLFSLEETAWGGGWGTTRDRVSVLLKQVTLNIYRIFQKKRLKIKALKNRQ